MSVPAEKLTRERFRELYADQKPNWELIEGVPEQKACGSKRHSFLQVILGTMLAELGFRTGVELTLEISEDWEPVPDVAGVLGPWSDDKVYQASPPAVVIEILSPSDRFSPLINKCRRYSEWGIPDVLVFDRVAERVWKWDNETLIPVQGREILLVSARVKLRIAEAFRRLREEEKQ